MKPSKSRRGILKSYQGEILDLYFGQHWKLKQIREYIHDKYAVDATEKQYKQIVHVKNSGQSKNIPALIWHYIISEIQARQAQNKQSRVLWDGEDVSPDRVNRELTRYNPKLRPSGHIPSDSRRRVQIRTPPITGPSSPRSLEFLGDTPGQLDDAEDAASIAVPSIVLSEQDYGCLRMICRELYLSGIPVFGRGVNFFPEDDDLDLGYSINSLNRTLWGALLEPPLPNVLQQSLHHTWSWEVLASIFASDVFSLFRGITPGFPKSKNELRFCSKRDLLNMAINTLLSWGADKYSFLFDENTKAFVEIYTWFAQEAQHDLLCRTFRSRNERVVSLAWLVVYSLPHMRLQLPSSLVTRTIGLGFLTLEEFAPSELANVGTCSLLPALAAFHHPSRARKLFESNFSIQQVEEREVCDAFSIAVEARNWSFVSLLLNHKISSHTLALSIINLPDDIPDETLEGLLPLLPPSVIDGLFSGFLYGTFPFTFAERFALRSHKTARLLIPFILDPLSLRICQILVHLQGSNEEKFQLDFFSDETYAAAEIALLGAVASGATRPTVSLLKAGVDPNCPRLCSQRSRVRVQDSILLTWCNKDLGGECTLPIMESQLHASARFRTWAGSELQLPLDLAIEMSEKTYDQNSPNTNLDLVRHLLEANARLTENSLTYLGLHRIGLPGQYFSLIKVLAPCLLKSNLMHLASEHLLSLAISDADTSLINILLGLGLQLNYLMDKCCPAYDQQTPLSFALVYGSIHTVKLLWTLGARFRHGLPLAGAYEACQLCKQANLPADVMEKLEFLIDKGARVDIPCNINGSDKDNYTPLQEFTQSLGLYGAGGKSLCVALDIVKMLKSGGADVNAQLSNLETPLQAATKRAHFSIMEFLIDQGAEVNLRRKRWGGEHTCSPLAFACSRDQFFETVCDSGSQHCLPHSSKGAPEVIRYLIRNGADVNQISDGQLSPLATACLSGNLQTVQLLIELGADVDLRSRNHSPDVFGRGIHQGLDATPLQHFCSGTWPPRTSSQSLQIVQCLLDHNANVNADPAPLSTLQGACLNGNFNLALLLLEHNADVNAPSNHSSYKSAIDAAAAYGGLDIVKMLINAGAEQDIIDNKFANAIRLARNGSHLHIVKLLKDARENL